MGKLFVNNMNKNIRKATTNIIVSTLKVNFFCHETLWGAIIF